MRIAALHASLDELDYYELLDVEPSAAHDDIRDAFYRFATDLHPDQHRAADADTREKVLAIFKRGNEAYSTLSSAKRRKRYDEGLGRGEKRLAPETSLRKDETPTDPAISIQTSIGRQQYRIAIFELGRGNLDAARAGLAAALAHEGPNPTIEEKLREVERKMRGETG